MPATAKAGEPKPGTLPVAQDMGAELLVNDAALSSATATKALMPKPSNRNVSGVSRWTACEAFTWAAFGEARPYKHCFEFPRSRWSCDWIVWPPGHLSHALLEIATGERWVPDADQRPPPDAENSRAHARRLIRETGLDARQLNDALSADTARHGRNVDLLREAWLEVMAGVRQGRLMVWGRPALARNRPKPGAVHEKLDPLLFQGPRAISVLGEVDEYEAPQTALEVWAEQDAAVPAYDGPWFDAVLFDEAQVRRMRHGAAREQPDDAVAIVWIKRAVAQAQIKGHTSIVLKENANACARETGVAVLRAQALMREHVPASMLRTRGKRR